MGDANEQPDVGQQESEHPNVLKNQDPVILTTAFGEVTSFLQQYGWFIVIGILVVLYILNKLKPAYQKLQQQAEDIRDYKKFDPDVAHQRLERMEAARRRLQEEHDAKAAAFAEQQQIKDEQKRQQKIQEYEDKLSGKSTKAKFKAKEEDTSTTINKPKPKARLRQTDYSPLMGGGGSGYRPPRRGGGGG